MMMEKQVPTEYSTEYYLFLGRPADPGLPYLRSKVGTSLRINLPQNDNTTRYVREQFLAYWW